MSIESANAFVAKVKTDQKFAAKLNQFKTTEEIQTFLCRAGFDFTREELNQVSGELQDSDLSNVLGGAIPTAVNSQITDAIT